MTLRFGAFELDELRCEIHCAGHPVAIHATPQVIAASQSGDWSGLESWRCILEENWVGGAPAR